jgi:glycosyltransferase involved in cell wall biosynthesis
MNFKDKYLFSQPLVTILMSTYNGDLFLCKQIDSILDQSYKNIKLIIRDDGSFDNTLKIIENYLHKYPSIINLIDDSDGNIGSTKSFLKLLNYVSKNSYVMFSDQDDVWFDNKVELFISKIQEIEFDNSKELPSLIFGDMVVSDSKLNIIEESFWNYQKINPNMIFDWKKTLSQNVVTGCSMILNYEGVQIVKNAPNLNVIHDHFIAICISKNGVVNYLSQPTMFYVQHNNNVLGASYYGFKFVFNRIKKLKSTIFVYYELCSFFNMNFLQFLYFKININFKRFF